MRCTYIFRKARISCLSLGESCLLGEAAWPKLPKPWLATALKQLSMSKQWLMRENLYSFQTLRLFKQKGEKGKLLRIKKERFWSIHMVPSSVATLFLKEFIENGVVNTSKFEQTRKKMMANCVAIVSVLQKALSMKLYQASILTEKRTLSQHLRKVI